MGNANQKPKQQSSTFTCEICFEQVTLPNNKFKIKNHNHPLCKDCMIQYIEVKLDDNVSDIKCPDVACEKSLEPLSCRSLIAHQLFDKWCDKLCDSAVLQLDTAYCPNQTCGALVINECGGKLRRCVCPNCTKPFCFRCKIAWHAGSSCEEKEIEDRNGVAFGVLYKKKKWKRCPVCRHCVERVYGCTILRCRCGTKFCYRCGKKLDLGWCGCKGGRTCTIFDWIVCVVLVFVILSPIIFLTLTAIAARNRTGFD